MSDDFVISQRDYYRKNLTAGEPRDWPLVRSLYDTYNRLCIERGLK